MQAMTQVVWGYIFLGLGAILFAFGGVVSKTGHDRLQEERIEKKNVEEKHQQMLYQQSVAKLTINRIIKDAGEALQTYIKKNSEEIERINGDFNMRNMVHGGGHVKAHIERVNSFIREVKILIKETARKIEDSLLLVKMSKLEDLSAEESRNYNSFIDTARQAAENIKKQNYNLCSRFTDTPTLDKILNSIRYEELKEERDGHK